MQNYFQPKSAQSKLSITPSQPTPSKAKQSLLKDEALLSNPPTVLKLGKYKQAQVQQLLEEEKFSPKTQLYDDQFKQLPFFLITELFELISNTQGKNSIQKKKNYIQQVFEFVIHNNPEVLTDLYHFCILRTDVEWLQRDLGVGPEILLSSIKTITGLGVKQMREKIRQIGDPGSVLEEQKSGQQNLSSFYKNSQKSEKQNVTFRYVFESIKELSNLTGEKSK